MITNTITTSTTTATANSLDTFILSIPQPCQRLPLPHPPAPLWWPQTPRTGFLPPSVSSAVKTNYLRCTPPTTRYSETRVGGVISILTSGVTMVRERLFYYVDTALPECICYYIFCVFGELCVNAFFVKNVDNGMNGRYNFT